MFNRKRPYRLVLAAAVVLTLGGSLLPATASTTSRERVSLTEPDTTDALGGAGSQESPEATTGKRQKAPRPPLTRELALQPGNDAFADAATLPEAPSSVAGDNVTATTEPGEPLPCGAMGATVWYRLDATEDRTLTANTFDADYDTVLAVYDGSTLGDLSLLDCNDDTVGLQSEVVFDVDSGRTYYLQVGGFSGDWGSFTLAMAEGSGVTGGSISGYVTGEDGPIDEVCVDVYAVGGWWVDFDYTETGAYQVAGLDPGDYAVRFSDCAAEPRYIDEWFDDMPDRWSATRVSVEAGADISGVDAVLALGGSIAGRLVDDAGDPLEACVEVYRATDPPSWAGEADSDPGTGSFHVGGLEGEAYLVEAWDCWQPLEHVTTWFDGRSGEETADEVVVTEGAEATIEIAMPLGGSISGRVTDEDGGAVTPCIGIYDMEGRWVSGWHAGNEDGTYVAGAIPTGDFAVKFIVCGDFNYASEFYDDRSDIASADPVAVTLGENTAGVDASLRFGASISGRVSAEGGAPLERACIDVFDAPEGTLVASGETTDGDYVLEGLPGWRSYEVRFRDCGGTGFRTEWWDDRPSRESADHLFLQAQRVSGIDAILAAAPTTGSLQGRVVSGSFFFFPISGVPVDLYEAGEASPLATAITGGDGGYAFADLTPGAYQVHFRPESTYVAEWYDDARERDQASSIQVLAGDVTDRIDADLETFGRISGSVRDEQGRSIAGACLEVFDDGAELIASRTTDANGWFQVLGLHEGSYRLSIDPCGSGPYLAEWHADADSFETATPIAVSYGGASWIEVELRTPEILLWETGGQTSVEEAGAGDTYSVRLSDPPGGDVTIAIEGDGQVTASPAELTFTTGDWSQPRSVAVEAVDDEDDEDDVHPASLSHVASGDATYAGLSATLGVAVADNDPVPIPTTLTYAGEASAIRGTQATLSAVLTEEQGGTPVPGRTVRFTLGAFEAAATTDSSGRASVQMTALEGYGVHEVAIAFGGDELWLPTASSSSFEILWEHEFVDGDNAVRINTPTSELQFVAPGDTSEVKQDPAMMVEDLPTGEPHIRIAYRDTDLTLVGEFLHERGAFVAGAVTPSDAYLLRGLG